MQIILNEGSMKQAIQDYLDKDPKEYYGTRVISVRKATASHPCNDPDCWIVEVHRMRKFLYVSVLLAGVAPAHAQQACGNVRMTDPYSGRLVTVYIPCEQRPRYEPRSPYDRTYPYDPRIAPTRPPPRWQPWPDYGPP